MILDSGEYEPILAKGKMFEYYKGLIKALKKNPCLVERSFHSALLGDKDLLHHDLQTGDFVYWKRHLHKDALQFHEGTLLGTLDQLLCS